MRVHTDAELTGIAARRSHAGFAGHEHVFVGRHPLELERHNRAIDHITFHYGRCWPLNLALWDLAGKIAGLPCWRMLGGHSDRVPCYASAGTLRTGPEFADLAERVLARGFKAMKLRFSRGDWRGDIAKLEAVRARIGNKLELMVDCNQGWRFPWDTISPWTYKDALAVGRELERLGVYWMEEPLARSDRAGMKRLREALNVRIAGGDFNREPAELRDLLIEGAVDVIQPDVVSVGGMTGLQKVAHMAAAHGVTFTPHTWGNGIGLLGNAHVMAGVGAADYLEFPWDPPEWTAARRDYVMQEPIEVDANGDLVLPETPASAPSSTRSGCARDAGFRRYRYNRTTSRSRIMGAARAQAVITAYYEAFNRGDIDGMLACASPTTSSTTPTKANAGSAASAFTRFVPACLTITRKSYTTSWSWRMPTARARPPSSTSTGNISSARPDCRTPRARPTVYPQVPFSRCATGNRAGDQRLL